MCLHMKPRKIFKKSESLGMSLKHFTLQLSNCCFKFDVSEAVGKCNSLLLRSLLLYVSNLLCFVESDVFSVSYFFASLKSFS